MKTDDIANAIKARIANGMSPSGVWPNVNEESSMTPPYYVVEWAARRRTGGLQAGGFIKGGEVVREFGRVQVALCVTYGTSEAVVNGYVDTLAALFPEGQSLSITGGTITITDPVDPRPGYRDGAEWRVPVVISYDALST